MDKDAFRQALMERAPTLVPHLGELGVRVSYAGADHCQGILACRPEFVGDVERGLIHTGVVTTLIDSVAGLSIFAHLGRMQPLATLDLRVDYLRATRLACELSCRAECYRMTDQIAFVRAEAWQDSRQTPVATALATFMLGLGGEPGHAA